MIFFPYAGLSFGTIEDTDLEDFEDWEAPTGNNNMKFEYIAREVEPQPYPGFKVEDFVEYPELAKEAGIEGRVIIAAFINKKGINTFFKSVFSLISFFCLQECNS